MIPMILFIIIAFLGGFHVISVETTAWGFAVWFVIMIARAGMSRVDEEGKGRIDILVPPMGLGGAIFDRSLSTIKNSGTMIGNTIAFGDYESAPPQGGDATIPVDAKQWAREVREVTGGRQRNTALLALMKMIEQEIDARKASKEIAEKDREMSYEEFARDIKDYRNLMERTKIGNDWLGKNDESYDEPMACYPETMRHE